MEEKALTPKARPHLISVMPLQEESVSKTSMFTPTIIDSVTNNDKSVTDLDDEKSGVSPTNRSNEHQSMRP